MPDIFLSYSREDLHVAQSVAKGLEREGFSVWWDQSLDPGEAYDNVTEKALREARAVVVLWSRQSVESRWVRAEATQADRSRKLVPAMIEPCTRPIMFELTQASDLSHWKGDSSDPAWRAYVAGLRRFLEKDAPAASPPPVVHKARSSRSSTIVIAVLAALLVAGAGLWAFSHKGGVTTPPTGVDPTSETASGKEVTLAVLPFADLSPAKDQEYFSDGLAEEILNQLAQVKGLVVTARTSSFSFKGKNEDMRVIGEKLGVANLLEGSVRKDGNDLRITAQLIDGGSGGHLWSKTYDREMSKVFALQEEIAKDVAQALSIKLDVGSMSRAQGGTTNLEAYDKYLRASALGRVDGPEAPVQGAQLYREAVALDPSFSLAWRGLYNALRNVLAWSVGDPATTRKEMTEVAARVAALAPDAWWTKSLQAGELTAQRKWLEADAAMKAARASAPSQNSFCGEGVSFGRNKAAIPCLERARQADPLNLALSVFLQESYDRAGRPADAQAEYERSKSLAGEHGRADHWALFRLMAEKDATPAAIKAQFTEFMRNEEVIHIELNHQLFKLLGDNPASLAAIRKALDDPALQDRTEMFVVALYADRYGDRDLALDGLQRYRLDLGVNPQFLWSHFTTNLRADSRFKEIVRKFGYVDYWRSSGEWGDFCKPVGADDFECH